MNRVFKNVWSHIHQQYVVTNEQHASRGKVSKSAVAVAIVGALMAGSASAAYQEMGKIGDADSWRTAEYQKDWGLEAMHAADAYALGFHGQDVKVAMMDSAALLQDHPELAGERWHAVTQEGTYTSSGNRYPQPNGDAFGNGGYEIDQPFNKPVIQDQATADKYPMKPFDKMTGQFIPHLNDTHGTHVVGTIGANRDGSEFHGVSWGSDIYVGNTGGTDNSNYGPYHDYGFFEAAWGALAAEDVKFINNSWGTNVRVALDEKDGKVISMPVDTLEQTEYEYFYFNKNSRDRWNEYHKIHADKYTDKTVESFVDAAWEAVKGKDTVQVFTTGNRNYNNPYYRALYPYFNPEAEDQWVAVEGLMKDGTDKNKWINVFNEAGNAKWWTICGPGHRIYSSIVYEDHYQPTSDEHPLGSAGYNAYSGTSMAAPHVTGALGVLASRYQDMTATQVRDVMFTTARHTNADGSDFLGWHQHDKNPVADKYKDFTPDELYGWGTPDLAKGMFGPGQFLKDMTYNQETMDVDVWSNDISQMAYNARLEEDQAWLDAHYNEDGTIKDEFMKDETFMLGDKIAVPVEYDEDGRAIKYEDQDFTMMDGGADQEANKTAQTIDLADAKEWRKAYFEKRKAAAEERLAKPTLDLIKDGKGTLAMTGVNTYEGTTTVKGGTLLAFAQSIGAKDAETERTVTAQTGATVGVLNTYNDRLTLKGAINADTSYNDKLNVVLENGSSLYVSAGSDVKVKSIDAKGANTIKIGFAGISDEALVAAYKGDGTLTATVEGLDLTNFVDADAEAPAVLAAVAAPAEKTVKAEVVNDQGEDAMISTEAKTVEVTAKDGKATATVKTTMKKVEDQAKTANQKAIAASLDGSALATMLRSSGAGVAAAMEALDDDFYAAARNATAVNALVYNRDIRDAAFGYGASRAAELDNGQARLWVAGSKHTGTADSLIDDMDTNFTAGTVGVEYLVNDQHKVGAFIGTGVTKFENERGNIHSDDLHAGVYGLSDVADFSVLYGVSMDRQDRDVEHIYNGVNNKHSEKADVAQLFTEVAYNGLKTADVTVTPYAGLSWMRINTKAFSEGEVNFDKQKDDLGVVTVGARAALPFNLGTLPMSVKADAGYSHFVGDTESVTKIQVGSASSFAEINGKELKGQFNLGLGVNAYVGKNVTVGISYSGAVAGKADTHGVNATLRVNF